MKRIHKIILASFIASISFLWVGCTEDDGLPNDGTDSSEVPAVYKKIYGASEIYVDGDFVVIKTDGIPDHKSPYYEGTQWSNQYEAYNGTNPNWNQNPNRITLSTTTYRIPLNPKEVNSGNQSTNLGSMGVALNGVALFNQYAGPNNQPLTSEINSFDQYNGHPQQQGVYHYHVEPTAITKSVGKDALLGFLLDGFPVYGPLENGVLVQESDLDNFHGHKHATEDYPGGIYHYHITDLDPYINGDGYKGTPGTATR